jgi:hypothetical protein
MGHAYLVGSFAVAIVVMAVYGLVPFLIGTVTATEQVTPILTDVTLPCSVGLFGAALWWGRRLRPLAPVFAFSAVVAALALFEDTWHLVGSTSPGFGFSINQAGWIILGTWTAFGLASAREWRVSVATGILGLLFMGVFVAWRVDGYPQLATGGMTALWFNGASKALAFLFVGALVAPTGGRRLWEILARR